MSRDSESISRRMNLSYEAVFRNSNACDQHQESESDASEIRNSKTKFIEHHVYSSDDQDPPKCMVMNEADRIKVAHIIPHRIDVSNSFRSQLLLPYNLEIALYGLKVSFIPDAFVETKVCLKIWDDSVRDIFVWDGSSKTIGSLEGRPFLLTTTSMDIIPFERCLSDQAQMAYLHYHGKVPKSIVSMPDDCSSGDDELNENLFIKRTIRDLNKRYRKYLKAETDSQSDKENDDIMISVQDD